MKPSETDDNTKKKPRLGRRELGILLLLLALNWGLALFQAETLEGPDAYAAAGLEPAADEKPLADPATLVTA